MALLPIGGTHVHQSDAGPDLRRCRTHLESMAGFVATFQVRPRSLGLRIECSLQGASIAVTEMLLGSSLIPA